VLPGELFPTSWKATGHGIASAAGKAGAIVGAFGFLYASQPRDKEASKPYPPGIGLRQALGVLAAINFVGVCFTFLIPETKGRTLEEINGEYSDLPLHLMPKRAAVTLGVDKPASNANGSAATVAEVEPPASETHVPAEPLQEALQE
jgi:PHS family inorganic phosphate transporter-like MFS transporter